MPKGRKRVSSSQPAMNSKLQHIKSTSSANDLHQPQETTPHSNDPIGSMSQPLVPTPSVSKSVKRTNKSINIYNNHECSTDLCTVCNQLTSTTSVGTDALKCCLCGLLFHGECLTISSKNMPYLYIMVEIGGWCCALCRNRNQTSTKSGIQRVNDNSTIHSAGPNTFGSVEIAGLKTDLDSLKVTIQTLSDQIKEISTKQPSFADVVKSKSIPSSSKSSSQSFEQLSCCRVASKYEESHPIRNYVLQ